MSNTTKRKAGAGDQAAEKKAKTDSTAVVVWTTPLERKIHDALVSVHDFANVLVRMVWEFAREAGVKTFPRVSSAFTALGHFESPQCVVAIPNGSTLLEASGVGTSVLVRGTGAYDLYR
jgi:hypothetical protein